MELLQEGAQVAPRSAPPEPKVLTKRVEPRPTVGHTVHNISVPGRSGGRQSRRRPERRDYFAVAPATRRRRAQAGAGA
eukprot:10281176-Alexandrium_andersonii.AAC.1